MRTLGLVVAALALSGCAARQLSETEPERWARRAARVTITRDDWGIAHIHGPTDPDAVFGMIYTQAEDDFRRVEANYLMALGRLAEADGESGVWSDVRARLYNSPDTLQARYARTPRWLQELMIAWADGLNYYLATHPEVKPRAITRFEPWMPLAFSEGSIGGDIEGISTSGLAALYGGASGTGQGRDEDAEQAAALDLDARGPAAREPGGSNGIAIAPARTAANAAMLLINPHTSFYFRSELHVSSNEGLNAYGAATWGQFFIYQGFNDRAGWMHTSSGTDRVDEYLETIVRDGGRLGYRYDGAVRPIQTDTIRLLVRTPGGLVPRTVVTYRTHHGPIVRAEGDKWVSVRMMDRPIDALTQSWLRIRVRGLQDFRKTMEYHTNSTNNTLYADADGNIAYFHANFVPRRDPAIDWLKPVDGSTSRTEWGELHTLDGSPNAINPRIGWVFNTNNWPYSAAGPDSPKPDGYPSYFDWTGENPRGIHALRVLADRRQLTPDSLMAMAYDPDMPAFDDLMPGLMAAYDALPAADPRRRELAEPIRHLRAWDRRWAAASVATTLAILWGEELSRRARADIDSEKVSVFEYMARRAPADLRLGALSTVIGQLRQEFGTWELPWGELNRFQRLSPDIAPKFDDAQPSTAVPFASARWGSLASYGSRPYPNTKRWYGTSGNSFVAVVQFGPRVSARAVMAGGQSSDPASPHFRDQVARYAAGALRPVYFHADELDGHVARRYRPGERTTR